jgi:hypothetical protein
MAQTGFTPISLYYATTAAAAPSAGNLVNGELAINITDGKLYYKDNVGAVQLLASKATATGPAGSNTQVQFNSSGSFGASSNFTWSGTVLAITGAVTATADSTFSSTGALTISKGTTLQQPGSPVTGMLRYNTTTNQFEGYSGASPAWTSVGGATISNDTSTSSYIYPLFAAATSGTALTVYTSNAKYLYKPSTGDLQAQQFIAANGFVLNPQTLTASYTIPANYSASTVGPFTIPSGMSVTVDGTARWVVL